MKQVDMFKFLDTVMEDNWGGGIVVKDLASRIRCE